MDIKLDTNFADGRTVQEFCNILAQRMKYCHETARDAVAAMSIDVLRSIRAVTIVAKPSSVKVEVKRSGSLEVGFEQKGNVKYPVIRQAGSHVKYNGKGIIKRPSLKLTKTASVFEFIDKPKDGKKERHYLILANTQSEARQYAKQLVKNRIMSYAGLAKRAIGCLMMKTSTVKVSDQVSAKIQNTARKNTTHREVILKSSDDQGGRYGLILEDSLKYAVDATRGGQSAIDTAMRKALNKIVSTINRKIREVDFLGNKIKIDSPFPDLKQRK